MTLTELLKYKTKYHLFCSGKHNCPLFVCILFLCFISCKTTQQTQSDKRPALPDEVMMADVKAGQSATDDTLYIERTFIDACKAKALNDYEGAIVLLNEILNVDANNAPALYELGRIYFEFGKIDEAKERAYAAVKSDGKNFYYQLLLADILTYNNEFKQAAEILEQLRQTYPGQIDNYFQLAYIYDRMNQPAKSLAVMQDAQKQFGNDEVILFELQRLYIRNRDVENAVTNLQKLITLNPGNPSYYNMITDVFELAMGTPQQEAIFATLLSLDPGNPDLLMRKAELEKIKGNYAAYYENMKTLFADASIPIDKKIFFLVPFVDSVELKNFVQKEFVFELTTILTKTHPDDAKAFAMRADFLYYDKQTQEARKHYRQSVSIRQDVYDVWLKLLYIDAGEGQNDSLLYVSGQCIELFPNQPTAYYFNGIALMGLMRYQDAVKSFKKALPMAVGNPQLKGDIYLRLGDVYNELKNYTESDAAYEASLQLDPKNPYTLNNYAYHLSLRSERLDDAAIMAKLANELVPGNPSLLDTYAWILYKQQNFKEAKKWLEEAMQKGGNKSVVIVEHYGDVLFRLGEKETALQYWNKAKQLGTGSEFLERKISEGILYE